MNDSLTYIQCYMLQIVKYLIFCWQSTPATTRWDETPGHGKGGETPGATPGASTHMWDATPGHATPGHATPGRDTPSHDRMNSSRRNRWDETPKTERGTASCYVCCNKSVLWKSVCMRTCNFKTFSSKVASSMIKYLSLTLQCFQVCKPTLFVNWMLVVLVKPLFSALLLKPTLPHKQFCICCK